MNLIISQYWTTLELLMVKLTPKEEADVLNLNSLLLLLFVYISVSYISAGIQ